MILSALLYYNHGMAYSEHIYTPDGDSLEARISAYKAVREAWLNAEASLKFLDDDLWADRLGDRDNVEEAYRISTRSLKMATDAISQDEIQIAITQGFVDADEAREFMQHKRREEMQSIRDNQQADHSSTHRHK